MIIDGKKIAKVDILNPEGNIVVTLEDDGATKFGGYNVNVYLDLRPGPDAIAAENDVLYYKNEEETKYIVVKADAKFFTMAAICIDDKDKEVKVNFGRQRTYPNNRKIGTLLDYGLVLDYREGEPHACQKENCSCH